MAALPSTGRRLLEQAISPDGSRVAFADRDGRISVVDLRTRALLTRLQPGERGSLPWNGLAWSTDGRWLAVGAGSEIVRYDGATLAEAGRARLPAVAWEIAFLPDGTLLVAVRDAVHRIDPGSGREVGPRLASGRKPRFVSVSADGSRAVVASHVGGAPPTLWEVNSGRLLRTLADHWAIGRLRPDGHEVAVVFLSADNSMLLVDADSGQVRHRLRGHTAQIDDAHYSPDGRLLITAGDDFVAKVWSTETGALINTLTGHLGFIRQGKITSDGATAVTVSLDGLALVWDLTGRRGLSVRLPRFAAPRGLAPMGTDDVPSADLSPDGSRLVAGTRDGHITIVSLLDGRLLADDTTAHPKGAQDTAVSGDSRRAATAGGEGTVRLWDLATGKPLGQPVRQQEPVLSVALDRRAERLAYGDGTGQVRVVALSPPGVRVIRDVDLSPPDRPGSSDPKPASAPTVLEFSPDGSALAVGLPNHGVALIKIASGTPRWLIRGDINPGSFAFSPDGTTLSVGENNDGSLLRLRVPAGGQVGERHSGAIGFVFTVAHTPDGRMATSGSEGTVRLWDPATGQTLGPPLPGGPVSAFVGFTPHALRVVHGDGTVTDWPTDLSAWRARACAVAARSLTRREWSQYLPDRPYAPACVDGRYVG